MDVLRGRRDRETEKQCRQEDQNEDHIAPRSRDKPGRGPARGGTLDKRKADTDEPDEQAKNAQAPEAYRKPRVRRGVGKSRRRIADSKCGSLDVLRVLDRRVADEGSDVGSGGIAERVTPGAPFQELSLREAVPLFQALPYRVVHAWRPPDVDGDKPRAERHLQRSIRRGGDHQAEEAGGEETGRRGVRSGLHAPHGRPARDVDLSQGRSRDGVVGAAFSPSGGSVIRPVPFLFATCARLLRQPRGKAAL